MNFRDSIKIFNDAGSADMRWQKITIQLDAAQRRIFYGFPRRNLQRMVYVYDDNDEVKKRMEMLGRRTR